MAAWTEDDCNSKADGDIVEEPALMAKRYSSLECDIDVSDKVACPSATAAVKRSSPFMDTPSEKSGFSLDDDSILDGDLGKDSPAGDGALVPGLSDISLPPKHTITPDPLDLSEGDDAFEQQPRPSNPLPTILEEPELEAQLEMEHLHERNPEELSTHMEEEPAPLVLEALPIQDSELSTEHGNDVLSDLSEPELQMSKQSLAECGVHPEISDISLKEDEATSTPDVIAVEDLPVLETSVNQPVLPKSPYQTRNRPQVSPRTQRSQVYVPEKLAPPPAESRAMPTTLSQRRRLGGHRNATSDFTDVKSTRSVSSEAGSPVMAKGSLANQFLEKIGQLRGAAVLSEGGHDTYALAEDLMSIEGAQKQPEKYKKEEFGELFTKNLTLGAQPTPKLQAECRVQTGVGSNDDEEDSSANFDHLPIRSRMDIWKKREDRAIRMGISSGLVGTENAHDAARALVYRVLQSAERDSFKPTPPMESVRSPRNHATDKKITFKEILRYYPKATLKYSKTNRSERGKMIAWTDDDWNIKADLDIVAESALVAARNSSLKRNVDVSVTAARSSDTAAVTRSGRFVDTPSEESGLSLDEDSLLDGNLEKDHPAGDGAFIPEFSDIARPPKHTITPFPWLAPSMLYLSVKCYTRSLRDMSSTDVADLSSSEGDGAMGQQQRPFNPLPMIPEEPELEAQLEMEYAHERNPGELSTHMEEEQAPLGLDALPIRGSRGLSTEPENDLNLWERDDALAQQPRPFTPLPTIPEEPELEAQLEMEHRHERNPEELSTHMEEDPAPLVLDELRIQDSGLSIEHGNDVISDLSEPELQVSNLSLAESGVHPEIRDISLKEDETTSTPEVVATEGLPALHTSENQPVWPRSRFQTRNSPRIAARKQPSNVYRWKRCRNAYLKIRIAEPGKVAPPPAECRALPTPLFQRSRLGGHRKAPSVLIGAKGTRPGTGVAPPVMTKGSVGNQFLHKIDQLPGSAVLSEGGHDTYQLAQDLMSFEGAQKQPDILEKEEFGELSNKKPDDEQYPRRGRAARLHTSPKIRFTDGQLQCAQSRVETGAQSDDADEDSSVNFDHLPIRSRIDIWKRREDRAMRKGMILIPKVGKQGRFPISATSP
ncbi:hypothetical protein HPB50_020518 [Hyalomma asiaticum]|uniref:Uncharacterized protein n=1 Tax=Hyalomma asiaticum TaxID=266040 RepID=A0ACB7T8U7_HYAAI|nr:hypothetical protein HPB50_020518 [Hyalomma asiaticum]